MSTQAAAPKAPKTALNEPPIIACNPIPTPKSISMTLTDKAGDVLVIGATRRKDGTWHSAVNHVTGKGKAKKNERGASGNHADLATARRVMEAISAQAQKAGWIPRPKAHSFAAKPDAFDLAHLPPAKK